MKTILPALAATALLALAACGGGTKADNSANAANSTSTDLNTAAPLPGTNDLAPVGNVTNSLGANELGTNTSFGNSSDAGNLATTNSAASNTTR